MAKQKAPPAGPGSRPGQYEQKLADYISRGEKSKHAGEVQADIRDMVDKLELEGVHQLRDTQKKGGRWSKQQQLAKNLTDDQLFDAYAGKPAQVPAAFRMKDISEDNVAFAYEVVTEPFVYLFRLPILAPAKVKRFAKTFIQWAKTHIPGGLPLLDHAILLASFLTPLADAGRRKARGESAKYPKKAKTPEPPELPGTAAGDSAPADLRGGRAA